MNAEIRVLFPHWRKPRDTRTWKRHGTPRMSRDHQKLKEAWDGFFLRNSRRNQSTDILISYSGLLNHWRMPFVILRYPDYGNLLKQPWKTGSARVNKIYHPDQNYFESRLYNSISIPQAWPLIISLTSSSNCSPFINFITQLYCSPYATWMYKKLPTLGPLHSVLPSQRGLLSR